MVVVIVQGGGGGGGDNAGQIWGIDQISHRKNLNFCGLDAQFLGGASTE